MDRWILSAKWAAKEIDCTVHGILRPGGCGAACCRGFAFWPPRSSGTGACGNLGPDGCRLGADKPVTCLLYPFRPPEPPKRTLGLHGRALVGTCRACYRRGGQSILAANRANFELLFGHEAVAAMLESIAAGRDFEFEPPAWVLSALAAEAPWAVANARPPGRAAMAAGPPPEHPALAALR
jgi:hypothetical protein